MSIFDGKRLTNETFKLDIDRMRRGWYSDKYFENINRMLTALSKEGYTYSGNYHNLPEGMSPEQIAVGDIEVEMQWFTRRQPFSVVAGVDKALAMLACCTGYFAPDGSFVNTYDQLEVEAVHDGVLVPYSGDPLNVRPVLRVRGRSNGNHAGLRGGNSRAQCTICFMRQCGTLLVRRAEPGHISCLCASNSV